MLTNIQTPSDVVPPQLSMILIIVLTTTRKRRLAVDKWEVYGSQMEQRDYEDLSSIRVEMTQVGVELNEETKNGVAG